MWNSGAADVLDDEGQATKSDKGGTHDFDEKHHHPDSVEGNRKRTKE
jgi:hypothetical protein